MPGFQISFNLSAAIQNPNVSGGRRTWQSSTTIPPGTQVDAEISFEPLMDATDPQINLPHPVPIIIQHPRSGRFHEKPVRFGESISSKPNASYTSLTPFIDISIKKRRPDVQHNGESQVGRRLASTNQEEILTGSASTYPNHQIEPRRPNSTGFFLRPFIAGEPAATWLPFLVHFHVFPAVLSDGLESSIV